MMDHGYFDGPWERPTACGDLRLLREVVALKKMEKRIFAFLTKHYVQRADERQKSLGIQYTEAETHDLAWQLAKFFASADTHPKADAQKDSQ